MTLKQRPNLNQQHFELSSPVETHRTQATCAEVDCPHYLHGWQTIVPVSSEQDLYLEHNWRKFVRRVDGGDAVYTFYPGQRCFRQHTRSLERPPVLIHAKPWQGYRQVLGSNEWHDTFGHTLEKFKREIG